MRAILPQHVKVGLVRRVMTSRFPCSKAHWYHPLCLPGADRRTVERFGSKDGQPFTLQSPPGGLGALSAPHQRLISVLLQAGREAQSPAPSLPVAFTEVGPLLRAAHKRKRATEDEEFLPGRQLPCSAKRRFAGACRTAVQDAIAAFKLECYRQHGNGDGQVVCSVSGKLVRMAEAHVDHAPPHTFDCIVEDFLAESCRTRSLSRSRFLARIEYVAGRFFDHDMAEAFRLHHAAHASLRVITASSNLALPRGPKRRRGNG